jgi:hypothetical protein
MSPSGQAIKHCKMARRAHNRGKPSAEARLRRKEKNEAKRARKRDDEQQQELSRLPSSSSRLPSLPTTGLFRHRTTATKPLIYWLSTLFHLERVTAAEVRTIINRNHIPDETITMTNKKKPRAKSLASTHVARHMEEEAEACS